MSQDIHSLLDDCQAKAEALVLEMEEYKSSRELHQTATDGLEAVSKALEEVIDQIRPYSEAKQKRFQTIMIVGTSINAFLLLIVLLILIF